MNFSNFRHSFDRNTKCDLATFLKTVSEASSNVYSNFDEYNRLKHYFPLPDDLKNAVESENIDVCIDITGSDEEDHPDQPSQDLENLPLGDLNIIKSSVSDIQEVVKDNLLTEKTVSADAMSGLSQLSQEDLECVFSSFTRELSMEEIQCLGQCLGQQIGIKDSIIEAYIGSLILVQMKQQFVTELLNLFLEVSNKFGNILNTKLLNEFGKLDKWKEEEIPVAVQYITSLGNNFKTDLLCKWIPTLNTLHLNCIPILDALLNAKVGNDVLFQLVVCLSSAATEFETENSYGKLLYRIVDSFDRCVLGLEQPLKHILGCHRSIWKIKIEKVTGRWFNDTLTQSFM